MSKLSTKEFNKINDFVKCCSSAELLDFIKLNKNLWKKYSLKLKSVLDGEMKTINDLSER